MRRLVLIGLIVSVVTVVVLISLIRSRRLQERHAMLWIAGTVVIVVLGASSDALDWVSEGLGIAYRPSTLFLVVVGFLAIALLDAVITLSKLADRNRALAQRLAIVEERLNGVTRPDDTETADARDDEHASAEVGSNRER